MENGVYGVVLVTVLLLIVIPVVSSTGPGLVSTNQREGGRVREPIKTQSLAVVAKVSVNKLGCASVKLLLWLEFTKALSDFITKKISNFSFKLDKESMSQFLA